jgi:AraC family ethanolamine operon transcriptional activator
LVPLEQSPPRLLINQQFMDIESLNGVFGWDLDWRQIEPGLLKFQITALGHADISVMRVEFNRSFHQIGTPPPDAITIGLPDIESGVLKSNGINISPGTLINFNYDNLLDTVNQGEFGGFVLSFSEAALRRAFSEIGVDPGLVKEVKETRFWDYFGDLHEQLRQLLQAFIEVAVSQGNAGLEKWNLAFNRDLPAITAQILAVNHQQPKLSTPKFQARALQRALQIINEYDQIPISVKSLSALAGASWSTLERAFLNEFGITPKAYSKVRRLTAVQSELIKHGSTVTIREIAGHWGFTHMGSFAADYNKQFGELPSRTLKRIESSTGIE